MHSDSFKDIKEAKAISPEAERSILLETNRQLNRHIINLQKHQWLNLLLTLVFGILIGHCLNIYAVYSSHVTVGLIIAFLLGLSLKARPEHP